VTLSILLTKKALVFQNKTSRNRFHSSIKTNAISPSASLSTYPCSRVSVKAKPSKLSSIKALKRNNIRAPRKAGISRHAGKDAFAAAMLFATRSLEAKASWPRGLPVAGLK
jgi:hypothetical protein